MARRAPTPDFKSDRSKVYFHWRTRRARNLYDYCYKVLVNSLYEGGSRVRRTARWMKRRKTKEVSDPGEVWSNHVGNLRRSIQFSVNRRELYCVIGPATRDKQGTAPRALEYGGKSRGIKTIQTQREREARKTYRKKVRKMASRGILKAARERQKQHIKEYYERPENRERAQERRDAKASPKKMLVHYNIRRRPRMRIALERTIPQMPTVMRYAVINTATPPARSFAGGTSLFTGWRFVTRNRHTKAMR